ncbi:MAG: lipoyl synthase [Pseudomonadales bacterium]|nr:lipoyl synthase [Pseudomonadales bacterium]
MSDSSVKSGKKFRTAMGFNAIKNGIKQTAHKTALNPRKPPWLRIKLPSGKKYENVRTAVRSNKLSTVCEESHCPNMGECWSNGTATIMLMGSVCTRACKFCSVDTGNPAGWLDPKEPVSAAESVRLMKLNYIVLTSVDRDDLPDGGAAHYAACITAIKHLNPTTAVEALTPDFNGVHAHIETVANSGLEVFAQNLETVKRLTYEVRDPRAGYQQTLNVLAHAQKVKPSLITKSSLMLGLGESDAEIFSAMDDLRENKVQVLTLGQYLRPTPNHLSVQRWVHPEEFEKYREAGLQRGFIEVASGPLVRSSYRAEKILEKNNLGLGEAPGLIKIKNL